MSDWIYEWMNQVSANRKRIKMHFITVMQVLWLFNTFTFAPYFREGATFFAPYIALKDPHITIIKFMIFTHLNTFNKITLF